MRQSNGQYWDMEAPTNEFRWRWNGGNIAMHITGNGDFIAYRDILASRNIRASLNFEAPSGEFYGQNVYVGKSAYGLEYSTFCKKGLETGGGTYTMLQDSGASTYLNGLSYVYFRINNNTKTYMKNDGVYTSNNVAVNSDDRLKYNEEDILGLSIINQLNPKKYIKIPVPFVKKRRRYYDENDITIIDNYIKDISLYKINEINQERNDICLNDLSFNEYNNDEEYIHKEIIEEEEVDGFVTEEEISNGRLEVGLIEQDVLETDISFVVTQQEIPGDMNGKPLFQPYAVKYGSVMPYCIQAIKDLYLIVQGLKDKINNLEADSNILEARVHALENV